MVASRGGGRPGSGAGRGEGGWWRRSRGGREQAGEASSSAGTERRRDPDDGKVYGWDDLMVKYKGHFSDEEIKAYWDSDCKVLAAGEKEDPEPPRKPYEQEEWYQKWLRRQQNKNRQIIEIG